MKKYALPLALALFTTSLHAQFRLLKNIDEVGLMAGPSLEVLRGTDNSEDNVPKIGYAAYLGVSWDISDKAGIKLRLGYHRKGLNQKGPISYWDDTIQGLKRTELSSKINIDYVVIPISYIYKPFNKKIPLYLECGFFASLPKKAQTIDIYADGGRPKELFDFKENIKKEDWGLTICMGYDKAMSSKYNLSFGLMYQLGLDNISKISSQSTHHILKTNSMLFFIAIKNMKKHN